MEEKIQNESNLLRQLRFVQGKIEGKDAFSDVEKEAVLAAIDASEQKLQDLREREHQISTVWRQKLVHLREKLDEREQVLDTLNHPDVFEIFREEHVKMQEELKGIRADIEK